MKPQTLFYHSQFKSLFIFIGKVASGLFPTTSRTFGDGKILALVFFSFFLSCIRMMLKVL